MKGKRSRKQIANLKRSPIRLSAGAEEELKALARSWLERPAHDIIVCPSLKVVDGHRRLEGLELLGETEVDVFVTDEELDDKAILQVGLSTAIHRADLTGYEKWHACKQLLELNPDWQGTDLATFLNLSPSSITHLLSPSKCIPEVLEALKAGEITISDCYPMSRAEQSNQAGLLALRRSGVNRKELSRQSRKQRAASVPSVRASKLVICLANEVRVTISGADLSLDEAIDAVKDAQREMARGRDQGLDMKTLAAVTRDKAKAGA